MAYVHGITIKELLTADGARRLDIVARNDGRFQYFEQLAHTKPDGGGWLPGKVSGLYETAEAAN